MKTRIIFAAATAVILAVVGVVVLRAAPAIGEVKVTPTVVGVNTPTQVTVTAKISDPLLIPTSVNLLRVDATGKTLAILGTMRDDGTGGDAVAKDNVFSYRLAVNEPSTGQVRLQVSAAFRGMLKRVLSPPITVAVWLSQHSQTLSLGYMIPADWSTAPGDDTLNILSPDLAAIQDQADAPPADITVRIIAYGPDDTFDSLLASAETDWYRYYGEKTTFTLGGHHAVKYSDVGAQLPHVPLVAVFVDRGSDVVLIVFSPATADADTVLLFDRFLASLSL
jgi:hypothetical protein